MHLVFSFSVVYNLVLLSKMYCELVMWIFSIWRMKFYDTHKLQYIEKNNMNVIWILLLSNSKSNWYSIIVIPDIMIEIKG